MPGVGAAEVLVVRLIMFQEVKHSDELRRILALPRRSLDDPQWVDLAEEMTEILRTPNGTMRLRPIQAMALHDIGVVGGLFAPIGVGEGKTLITLLAPFVLGAERPLLLLPASLIRKTERERRELAKHWLVSDVQMVSYEMLGRVQAASLLDRIKPDLIIADEVHKLKNRKAAVTRRVARYMRDSD